MQMDILEQIAAHLGIKLVSSREPLERGAVGVRRLLVQGILTHISARYGFTAKVVIGH
jgi:hypothetical protein